MIRLFILTGPSGAGKSTVQYVFEECGYFVMENILPVSLKQTLNYIYNNRGQQDKYLLICMPQFALRIYGIVKDFCSDKNDLKLSLMTLNCEPKVLNQRFKLTRHVHPATTLRNISLSEAIASDVENIDNLSGVADYRIDTSDLSVVDLRKYVFSILTSKKQDTVSLCFMSFGHKYSIPLDVDLVFDTRALPNPYWVESLRVYSGLNQPVIDYLESFPETEETFNHMVDYLDFYLQKVQEDGRGNYTIGICCSGGHHRSVYFADRLAKYYAKKYTVSTIHRDIDKDEK